MTTTPTVPTPADARPLMTPGSYLVGLPVVVTIGEDGSVTFGVCLEDASTAVSEDDDATPDHVAAVETATDARIYTVSVA